MGRLSMETEDCFISGDDPMETEVLLSFKNRPEMYFKDPSKNLKESTLLEMGKKLLSKVKLGLIEDVRDLMVQGAPFATDWLGTSPLHLTAYYNHPEVAQFLLGSGIPKDARNKADRTPLHIAAQQGNIEVLKILLACGCDVNSRDMLKMTPLHWAADSGHVECARMLLDFGAEISPYNKFEKTPCMIAQENNHNEIVKLICETLIVPPTVRTAKLEEVRKNTLSKIPKHMRKIEPPNPFKFALTQKDMPMKVVRKKKKIGFLVSKEDLLDGRVSDIVLSDESHEDVEDEKPKISDITIDISNHPQRTQGTPPKSKERALILSDSGKVLMNSPAMLTLLKKDSVNGCQEIKNVELPASSVSQTPPSPPKPPLLNSGKKIITIKAEQLINMTKERKVIIKKSRTIQKARMFEGKVYTAGQKEELLKKVEERLSEMQKEVDLLRQQLEKKEKEVENYKKQMESISDWTQS